MQRRLDMHVCPYIGSYHVGEITGPQLLEVLRRIESRGTLELAHRLRSVCGRVFRYAKATGRQCENVAADLSDLLIPFESEHMAAIVDPVGIGGLLRAIENYHGEPITRLALRLIPYIFPRPIEFRTMEWSQVNLNGPTPEWRVPWKRMMREPHIVPLSRQAVEILCEIQLHTGHRHYEHNAPVIIPISVGVVTLGVGAGSEVIAEAASKALWPRLVALVLHGVSSTVIRQAETDGIAGAGPAVVQELEGAAEENSREALESLTESEAKLTKELEKTIGRVWGGGAAATATRAATTGSSSGSAKQNDHKDDDDKLPEGEAVCNLHFGRC